MWVATVITPDTSKGGGAILCLAAQRGIPKDAASRSGRRIGRRRNQSSSMKQKAYAAAGVDIDLGNKVKGTLPKLMNIQVCVALPDSEQRTHRPP
jgi:hypothetical protein